MRILVVGINYAPEIISTGLYTSGLCEFLHTRGHKIQVVTSNPYYPEWRTYDGWRGLRWRRELRNGVDVTHCAIYVPRKPTGLKRILHNLSFAVSAFPAVVWHSWRTKPDVVLAVAPTLMSAPIAMVGAWLSGAKSWLHIQDLEIDAAFATGLLREGTPLGRLAQRFEAWVIGRFSRVSTISPQMRARLIEKGVPGEKTYELRNWADLSVVQPVCGISPLKSEFGIKTKYVALYAGNLGNKQGLDTIIDAARLLSNRSDISFVIAGEGPMKLRLKKKGEGLDNLVFVPLQPADRLSNLLGMADLHLLPQVAGAADLVLPSKLTNMLASGRPVIATAENGTGLWEEVQGVGLTVPPEDAVALSIAILELVDQPERRSTLGTAARQRAVERWSKETVLEKFFIDISKMGSSYD